MVVTAVIYFKIKILIKSLEGNRQVTRIGATATISNHVVMIRADLPRHIPSYRITRSPPLDTSLLGRAHWLQSRPQPPAHIKSRIKGPKYRIALSRAAIIITRRPPAVLASLDRWSLWVITKVASCKPRARSEGYCSKSKDFSKDNRRIWRPEVSPKASEKKGRFQIAWEGSIINWIQKPNSLWIKHFW